MITTGMIISAACAVRTLRCVHFDGACAVRKTSYEVVYFSIFTFTRHTFIWTLTMYKRNVGRLGSTSRAPVVSLVLRDGTLIFCVMSVIPSSVMILAVGQAMLPCVMLWIVLNCMLSTPTIIDGPYRLYQCWLAISSSICNGCRRGRLPVLSNSQQT